MVLSKKRNKRNILAYFLDSKVWAKHEASVVNNYAYWVCEDPNRARRMMAASAHEKRGYTVAEYIYDMLECVLKSDLKKSTRDRLLTEIDNLELYHQEFGHVFVAVTETDEVYEGYVDYGYSSMQAVLFRNDGSVFETLLHTFYDKYICPVQMELPYKKTCDCGGYKTYRTYDPHCHSDWCSVNRRNYA
jgi:hypothetical protein